MKFITLNQVCIHEAGHALMGLLLTGAVGHVSVIPAPGTAGWCFEATIGSPSWLRLIFSMAGEAAESLFSTWAVEDILADLDPRDRPRPPVMMNFGDGDLDTGSPVKFAEWQAATTTRADAETVITDTTKSNEFAASLGIDPALAEPIVRGILKSHENELIAIAILLRKRRAINHEDIREAFERIGSPLLSQLRTATASDATNQETPPSISLAAYSARRTVKGIE